MKEQIEVFLYCTKSAPYLYKNDLGEFYLSKKALKGKEYYNGKISFSFSLFDTISFSRDSIPLRVEVESCLKKEEILSYLGEKKRGYGFVISDLKSYKYSLNFKNFLKADYLSRYRLDSNSNSIYLSKVPRSWIFAYRYDNLTSKYKKVILMSIKSTSLESIANSVKKIEIRKSSIESN